MSLGKIILSGTFGFFFAFFPYNPFPCEVISFLVKLYMKYFIAYLMSFLLSRNNEPIAVTTVESGGNFFFFIFVFFFSSKPHECEAGESLKYKRTH